MCALPVCSCLPLCVRYLFVVVYLYVCTAVSTMGMLVCAEPTGTLFVNVYLCAETDNDDDGKGTMEALYFGTSKGWGHGQGNGPWVMADLGLHTLHTAFSLCYCFLLCCIRPTAILFTLTMAVLYRKWALGW